MSDVLKKLAFVAKKKKFCSRRQKDLGVKWVKNASNNVNLNFSGENF
jgi:hypothetical protein